MSVAGSAEAARAQLLVHAGVIQDSAALLRAVPLSSLLDSTGKVLDTLVSAPANRLALLRTLRESRTDVALVQLLVRYSEDASEQAAKFFLPAMGIISMVCSESREQMSHLVERGDCVPVMVCMLSHAQHDVRVQAAVCLSNIGGENADYRDRVLNCKNAVERITSLLESTTQVDETAELAQLVSNLAHSEPQVDAGLALPFVPAMSKLLREQIRGLPIINQGILQSVVLFFDAVVLHHVDESYDVMLSNQVPEQMAMLFQQSATLAPYIAAPALGVFWLLGRTDAQQFLNLGGFNAVELLSRDPTLGEGLRDVVAVLNGLVQSSSSSRQMVLNCEGLVSRLCDSLILYMESGEDPLRVSAASQTLIYFLLKTTHMAMTDKNELRQAILQQNWFHALILTLRLPGDEPSVVRAEVLCDAIERVGIPFCQDYVRGLLQTRAFFPLVDQFRFNEPSPDTVFSMVVNDLEFRESTTLVDLLVLLGVEETVVTQKEDGVYVLTPELYPEFYQRFRQAKVMTVLCATRSVARHRQRVVNLPDELWRMVKDMLCDYSPLPFTEDEDEDDDEEDDDDAEEEDE